MAMSAAPVRVRALQDPVFMPLRLSNNDDIARAFGAGTYDGSSDDGD